MKVPVAGEDTRVWHPSIRGTGPSRGAAKKIIISKVELLALRNSTITSGTEVMTSIEITHVESLAYPGSQKCQEQM